MRIRSGASTTIFRSLKLAAAGASLLALSACAENLDTSVTRFQSQLPPPAGQSFAIVALDPHNAGGIEFGMYAQDVAAYMTKMGYAQVATPDQATLVVELGYGVDGGHQEINSVGGDPFWGPWRGYRGWGGRGGGFGWGGWGGAWGGPGGAWGWGWNGSWIDTATVYTSKLELDIDNRADGRHLFEGHAEAASTSNHLTYLVPNLIQAMFTGFPGNSGQTVRITVAPEKK